MLWLYVQCVSVFLDFWWLGWYLITCVSLNYYSITRCGKTRSPKLKKLGKKLFHYGNILPHHEWFRQLYESYIIKHSITGSRACMILPFRKNEYYGGHLLYHSFQMDSALQRVLYSTLLHLPPLRFYWVGGSWDRTRDLLRFRRSNPSALDLAPYTWTYVQYSTRSRIFIFYLQNNENE